VKEQAWAPQEAVDAKTDCLGCHTSGYDPATAKWTELGVDCEMCHGPGSAHAGSAPDAKRSTIVNPKSLDPAHQAAVCGRCHSVGKDKDGIHTFSTTFRPGDDLDQSFTLTQNVEKGARNSQYNELRLGGGKHLAAGTACTSCHDPHGSKPMQLRAASVNELCLTCHQGKLQGAQHSEGALKAVSCATCHMSHGSHAFVPPHHG
jgi:predicted CXXCH cytochrome family protein